MSATWGVWLGVITAVGSALAFDYFHLPPLGSLSLRHGSDWVALATFLITAIGLGGLPFASRALALGPARIPSADHRRR